MSTTKKFRIALTADLYDETTGKLKCENMGLDVLDAQPHIEYDRFAEHQPQIGVDQLRGVQGALVWAPAVTAETVSQPENLLGISRIGVGFDKVDVAACTAADVAVFTTQGAVDRSLAEATITWMLSLTHQVLVKDRLLRNNEPFDQFKWRGKELRDRTFGSIGLGGIAGEAIRLLSIFGMHQPLAFDPYVDPARARELGVELVELDELMRRADFVSVHCPLNDQTRGLIGRRELELMKPDAYLINTARGGIVDEEALYEILKKGGIAGAGIDVFMGEPLSEPPRLAELDNVLLAPHAIGVTDELMRDIGGAACQALVDLSQGCLPAKGLLNPEVLEHTGFQQKWQRLRVNT